ncbi:MAG TPA: sigma-70 family RNA polymerase sigma factor [Candidatus Angelobacter sp.]|nr:sigma-70 family RNA polymerase sigma factor [Candidatus Angelobacter sp.]
METPYAEKTNLEVVEDCLREGTPEAWYEFVHRFQPLIARIAAQVARRYASASPALIDDLVQETYLKICANNSKLLREFSGRHENSIFSYLKVIAAGVALDHFKSQYAQKRGGGPQGEAQVESADQLAIQDEGSWVSAADRHVLQSQIETSLKKITGDGPGAERERLIFRLYYQQGFTAEAISRVPAMNLGAKGVESLLLRLVKALRKDLAQRHLRESAIPVEGKLADTVGGLG